MARLVRAIFVFGCGGRLILTLISSPQGGEADAVGQKSQILSPKPKSQTARQAQTRRAVLLCNDARRLILTLISSPQAAKAKAAGQNSTSEHQIQTAQTPRIAQNQQAVPVRGAIEAHPAQAEPKHINVSSY
ncbi:hypothetical protein DBIPINDM_003655 [Mesorhizobium sp. AR02]|uniref:hypothetical protein n=1 Tax=Mesorhizobium sp. AR02 TaxID=2865837 RepID=UPI002160B153|nr:hypothetical protein [Mesorhizobium sp. AR02]UVK50483.1 hypothetical protein DBIPINDM_003655 [Mesorhizobium sp. AR02]